MVKISAPWKSESIAHQRFFFFFPPSGIQLLDIHQQVTVSISDIGREQGEGLLESESQERERTRKSDGQNCQKLCRSHWV